MFMWSMLGELDEILSDLIGFYLVGSISFAMP